MATFNEQIQAIIADREHGSSTLVQWIIEALQGKQGEPPTRRQQRWALAELRRVDRSMILIHHLLDTLGSDPDDNLQMRLRNYVRQWSNMPERVTRQLLSFRDWSNTRVLLHSHSGMLLTAARQAQESAPGIRFWQTRSEPGGEGITQYRLLQEQGVDCELLEDERILDTLPIIDAAWLGADQFDFRYFVNKAGSSLIAREMVTTGKPVFVLGDSRKQVEHVDYSTELFEPVPFGNGVYLVTERGVRPTHSSKMSF